MSDLYVSDSEILYWIAKAKKPVTIKGIAEKHKKKLHKAILDSVSGVGAAAAAAATIPVAQAVSQNVQLNNQPVDDALGGVYDDSVQAGSNHAGLLLAMGAGLVIAMNSSRAKMNPIASTIAGTIGMTTLALISASINKGIGGNLSADAIEASALAYIVSLSRISMIADTETNRGFNQGVVGDFVANGVTKYLWINGESSCAVCQDLEGVHDVSEGDDALPPAHPNCLCEIKPVQ